MNNLKRIEGKTIKTVSEDTDGTNSYFIIKFEEGGKVNIVSFLRGDEGVAQLDIDLGGLQPKDLIGKQIMKVEEEFDGEFDHIFLHFRGGNKIEITPFSSSPVSTASLDVTLYSGDNIVAESLDENMYQKWGEYPMSKPQYESDEGVDEGIVIVLKSHPRSDKKILDLLNSEYPTNPKISFSGSAGHAGLKVIIIEDPRANIEDVSDLLYKYIENGTVHTVDEL